jgi:hypothetical protein
MVRATSPRVQASRLAPRKRAQRRPDRREKPRARPQATSSNATTSQPSINVEYSLGPRKISSARYATRSVLSVPYAIQMPLGRR